MNKRIFDNIVYNLAKEAGLIEFEMFDWNPALGSPTYESVMKARKFAELIVWECFLIGANYIQSNDDVSKFERQLKETFRS